MTADGDPLKVYGPNKVGLERHGVSPETQQALKQAYRIVFRSDLTTAQALDDGFDLRVSRVEILQRRQVRLAARLRWRGRASR